jgi:hypothetical protein
MNRLFLVFFLTALLSLLLFSGDSFAGPAVAAASPGPLFFKTLSIVSGQVPSTLTDFPLLVSISYDPDLKSRANGAHLASQDGSDIYFIDSQGANCYASEVESYSGLTSYNLRINIKGKGRVDVFPEQAAYLAGSSVRLTAIADAGWSFAGWGGASSHTNSVNIIMDSDKTVTVTFTEWATVFRYFVIGVGVLACGFVLWTARKNLRKKRQ